MRWGEKVGLDLPGVYVVASTPDLSDRVGRMMNYQPDLAAFEALSSFCPLVTVDGAPATSEKLAERIGRFWIPDSPVVYVGLAGTSVRGRVSQYYRTPIGHSAPHAGGWWLKTLANLDELYVHYARAGAPALAEARLLESFAADMPAATRTTLHDTERIAPFANVRVHGGRRKRHGMAGYKLDGGEHRKKSTQPAARVMLSSSGATEASPIDPTAEGRSTRTPVTRIESQVISTKDRAGYNLRIPARSKFALPAVDGQLSVSYQGQRVSARWRVNGSRSGTLALGKAIMSSLGTPNDSIWMQVDGNSVVLEA